MPPGSECAVELEDQLRVGTLGADYSLRSLLVSRGAFLFQDRKGIDRIPISVGGADIETYSSVIVAVPVGV
jgi:hypothetical protein